MADILRLMPPTPYDFGGLAAGKTQTLTLIQRIAAHDITEADILLRFHAITITTPAAPQTIGVFLVADANTEDDPANVFLTPSTTAGALASYVTPTGSAVSAPMLQVLSASIANGGKAFGRFLAVTLVATQGAALAMSCTISLDLARKGSMASSGGASRGYLGYAF